MTSPRQAGPVRVHGAILAALGVGWATVIAAGAMVLFHEEYTPVARAAVGGHFPAGSAVTLSPTEPTLVLFSHPLCPCTRATLHEMEEVVGEMPDKVAVTVVFTVAKGLPADWKQGDLWRSATTLRGVRVVVDEDGVEARRFGVIGSGHCLVYAPDGQLLFSGGITGSRGHEGENPGLGALRGVLTTGRADNTSTPVFGCSLL
jgi:hypothetical protein